MQFVLALLVGTLMACDGGSDKPQDSAPEIITAADMADSAAPLDVGAEEVAAAYPPGPFGTLKEATIADLGFLVPDTEETLFLHQWYQDPKVKLLMIVSTAAW